MFLGLFCSFISSKTPAKALFSLSVFYYSFHDTSVLSYTKLSCLKNNFVIKSVAVLKDISFFLFQIYSFFGLPQVLFTGRTRISLLFSMA